MNEIATYLRKTRCLLVVQLRREFRAPTTWPAVLLLGLVVVAVLALQLRLPPATLSHVAGGMLWLAIFLSGTLGLERAFANEREDGCWDALRMYPMPSTVIYWAKLLFNFITISLAASVLIPLYAVLCDAPLLARPVGVLAVTLLASWGLAAAGTLVGALALGLSGRGNMVALLLLPLVLPVVLAAGDATRLLLVGELDFEFWRWLQLLLAFAVMFTTAGVMLCPFLMED